MPAALELSGMIAAEDASAASPWGDSISTRPLPNVRMTPAADICAETDGERTARDDPQRQTVIGHVAGEMTGRHQRQGDDTHRLLRIIGSVRERHQRRRGDLAHRKPSSRGDGSPRG